MTCSLAQARFTRSRTGCGAGSLTIPPRRPLSPVARKDRWRSRTLPVSGRTHQPLAGGSTQLADRPLDRPARQSSLRRRRRRRQRPRPSSSPTSPPHDNNHPPKDQRQPPLRVRRSVMLTTREPQIRRRGRSRDGRSCRKGRVEREHSYALTGMFNRGPEQTVRRKLRPSVPRQISWLVAIQSGPLPRPCQLSIPVQGGCPARRACPETESGEAPWHADADFNCRASPAGKRSASRLPSSLARPGQVGGPTYLSPDTQRRNGCSEARLSADSARPGYRGGGLNRPYTDRRSAVRGVLSTCRRCCHVCCHMAITR